MSESEEMYLVSIARLKETGGEGPVPLAVLAAELQVLPVSANQMIRKLEDNGMVAYTPYKGVELTDQGRAKAMQVLRFRRLWEVFLVDTLKIFPREAGGLACKLEHDVPSAAAERLADFLGHPQSTPDGKPIPAGDPISDQVTDVPLSRLDVCQTGRITRTASDARIASFLKSEDLHLGARVQVLAAGSRGSLLVQNERGNRVHLAPSIAGEVYVLPQSE
ncbi:MAG TPA: metal-dependent transcriptional regulator [Anaerolineaceae bacterium]